MQRIIAINPVTPSPQQAHSAQPTFKGPGLPDLAATGCVLALYGDWNDALDGLGVSESPDREY